MGIARAMVKLLMREGKRENYSGHILTIGRQVTWVKTAQDLEKWAREMNFQLNPAAKTFLSNKKLIKNNYMTDIVLFSSLGFNKIDSLDYSDFEQCKITHDLNKDVPAELHNKYDLIFDAGTSEHVFNLPKVLENYHKMLKVGGRLIHALPSSNHVDHGFYMFSPTLFWDYYSANNWDIKDALFFRYSKKHDTELWDIYNYVPGCLDRFSFGGLNKGLYGVFFVVKKTDKSTFHASVQQGFYLNIWKSQKTSITWKKRIVAMLPEWLKLILHPLHDYIFSKIPLRFYLKIIGRY